VKTWVGDGRSNWDEQNHLSTTDVMLLMLALMWCKFHLCVCQWQLYEVWTSFTSVFPIKMCLLDHLNPAQYGLLILPVSRLLMNLFYVVFRVCK
jgi:hypothetical protein